MPLLRMKIALTNHNHTRFPFSKLSSG